MSSAAPASAVGAAVGFAAFAGAFPCVPVAGGLWWVLLLRCLAAAAVAVG